MPSLPAICKALKTSHFPGDRILRGRGGFAVGARPRAEHEHVVRLEEAGPVGRREMGQRGRHWLKEHASPDGWQAKFSVIVRDAIEDRRSVATT